MAIDLDRSRRPRPNVFNPRKRTGRSGYRSRLRHDGAVDRTEGVRPLDWSRDGALAGDIDFTEGAALVMPGLTAWQGLFEHGRLRAGQSVLVHGAAGVVGSMASQLAHEAGAYVIGTGRAGAGQTALDFGAQEFLDLDSDTPDDVGEVDLVFDVIGGDIAKRSRA